MSCAIFGALEQQVLLHSPVATLSGRDMWLPSRLWTQIIQYCLSHTLITQHCVMHNMYAE